MSTLFDFATFPILTTERLVLRQLSHADADAINHIFSDPQVIEFMSEPPLNSTEKAIELIDWMNGWYDKQAAARWGITLKGDDHVIGTCGFHKWNREHRYADLGYDLLPAYWGRGYGPEAARAVVAWCFDNLDLHRIQADCTDGNQRSERTHPAQARFPARGSVARAVLGARALRRHQAVRAAAPRVRSCSQRSEVSPAKSNGRHAGARRAS